VPRIAAVSAVDQALLREAITMLTARFDGEWSKRVRELVGIGR
jgi:hypothetical protein